MTDRQGVVHGELDNAVGVLIDERVRRDGFGVIQADIVRGSVIPVVVVIIVVGCVGVRVSVFVGVVGNIRVFGERDGDGGFETGGVGLQKKFDWLENYCSRLRNSAKTRVEPRIPHASKIIKVRPTKDGFHSGPSARQTPK